LSVYSSARRHVPLWHFAAHFRLHATVTSDARPPKFGYSGQVLRPSKIAFLLLTLATLAVPVRTALTHLHLCFDGQAPAVSLHVQELATHHEIDVSADGHNDLDLALSEAMPAKKLVASPDLSPVILGAWLLTAHVPPQSYALPPADFVSASPHPVFALHPPSRGPPV